MNRNGELWSKEEESFLIENYVNLGSSKCAEILGRTLSAIHNRVRKLVLKKEFEYVTLPLYQPSNKDIKKRVRERKCIQCKELLHDGQFGYCSEEHYNELVIWQ